MCAQDAWPKGKGGCGVSLPRGRGAFFQFAQGHLRASGGSAPPTREQAWLEISFMFTVPGLGGWGLGEAGASEATRPTRGSLAGAELPPPKPTGTVGWWKDDWA